ncbi:hypothetical protein GXW82_25585 [Streptacidiphilus sp. 4-A2]|nr:hypothetical protein [Streptacidiphilus sp. 4-A2]
MTSRMRSSRTARLGATVTAVALVGLLAACGSSGHTSSTAKADTAAASSAAVSPVGKWQVQVQTSLPSSGTAVLTFNKDGSLIQAGSDTLPGTGWWQPTSKPGVFTIEVVIPLTDHLTNKPEGTIRGFENVTLNGNVLSTSGHATMYDPLGKQLQSFTLSSSANGKLA